MQLPRFGRAMGQLSGWPKNCVWAKLGGRSGGAAGAGRAGFVGAGLGPGQSDLPRWPLDAIDADTACRKAMTGIEKRQVVGSDRYRQKFFRRGWRWCRFRAPFWQIQKSEKFSKTLDALDDLTQTVDLYGHFWVFLWRQDVVCSVNFLCNQNTHYGFSKSTS